MISIKDLKVWAWDKEILKWVSMDFELGKNYLLLGRNGSGKSTLASFLMWHPKYELISWEVNIDWEDLLALEVEDRSKKWLFLSFQSVPEIKGIKLSEYLRTIYNIALKQKNPETPDLTPFVFKRYVKKYLDELHLDEKFLERDLNVWFSWWEKRKIEMLQMKLVWPRYIILDEIDSGLDLDAFRSVAQILQKVSSSENTIIIITHHFKILDYIDVDKVYVLKDGLIDREWWKELASKISEEGYN